MGYLTAAIDPAYLERIRSMRPDLAIETVRQINEGGVNVVVVVNDAWVFRFVRTDDGRQALTNELRAFDLLRGQVDLALPDPVVRCDDAIAYHLIEGEALTAWLLNGYDDAIQQRIADQLAAFLRQMHRIPHDGSLPSGTAAESLDWCRYWHEEMRRTLYPTLDLYQREWADYLFEGALRGPHFHDFEPVLINNDIHAYHILFDAGARRINGLIDFGLACFGNPALDFSGLLQYYGEDFVARILRTYPEAAAFLPYARWVALLNELEWVKSGIEADRVTWHFRAHLGIGHNVRLPF
jgi:aminoglycoside 2''-phosphotransferase